MDHFHRFNRNHLHRLFCRDPKSIRGHVAVVETLNDHLLRNSSRRGYSRIGEDLHIDKIKTCARSRVFIRAGGSIAEHSLWSGSWKLLMFLAWTRHRFAHGYGLRSIAVRAIQHHDRSRGIRIRPGGFRLPRDGPVTIAVDSYGPVTDNAQSVYELSLIEEVPDIERQIKNEHGFDVRFERAKHLLEENDGAGNTFKATAKPVLIGTAVVGATTMIFSIIMVLTAGLTQDKEKLSLLHAPFVLGLISGGAVIYWFTGASIQAVTTGAHRAVEFIKANIKLEGATRASVEDSKKVVGICTQYAQAGMLNIFLSVLFMTLAFAFIEPYFFIGYLFSIAIFGLYQAIFMANAGGAWDNAKKIVEVELKKKGTPLHDATVVGDTVGDPFKDTSSVALNPVIKFTTLFGLLAVELAVKLTKDQGSSLTLPLTLGFLAIGLFFVWRSFYGMRIKEATA